MSADVYNQKGEVIGTVELPDRVFKERWNSDLVHQAVLAQLANAREPLAHARMRGEVSGGGKKPWRQKKTGRARHGSIRSPLWKGGGVAHGPRNEKVYAVKLNKKMRQKALFSALSKKVKGGEVRVVESFALEAPKTKYMVGILKSLEAVNGKSSALIVSLSPCERAARNIPGVKNLDPKSLNVYDVLRHKRVLIEREAVQAIDAHYHAV
ncbi:MAG: 50S ribosomal protein L4 [Candidatus Colwellbacteria bacterium]|nr:50S ribosomal protein L4 [Candidatus Colwellbacteria bacterium]